MSVIVIRILNAIAAVILILLGQPVQPIQAQDCPNGMCKPSTSLKVYDNTNARYEWSVGVAGQHLLRCDGVVVGQWYEGAYYPWDGGKVLAAAKPPIDPPGGELTKEQKLWCKSGTSTSFDGIERLNFSGKGIHPGRIREAFNGQLQDDSEKGYLVILAKDAATRDSVFQDWKALPTDFTDRYLVWQAQLDHFSVQDRKTGKPRFYTEGDPTVVLQKHDGTVLFRRPRAGQHYKASDMQDLLKSDPNYNPKLDPGGPASPSFSLSTRTTTTLALAGVGAIAFFLRRKP